MLNTIQLDLSPLAKSISQLTKSWHYYNSDLAKQDKELAVQFMAATIQGFEFTYEISIKFLRRYLKMTEPSAQVIEELTFPDLIRTGCEKGLLSSEWLVWRQYRDKRNITSHTYNKQKALEVMGIIPGFLLDVEYLLKKLEERTSRL